MGKNDDDDDDDNTEERRLTTQPATAAQHKHKSVCVYYLNTLYIPLLSSQMYNVSRVSCSITT